MTQPLEQQDMALLIEAFVRSEGDPMTRFLRALSDDPPMRLRSFAEETIRLREELLMNVQSMLIERDPRLSSRYAEWIARHAHEVAYRWSSLMRSLAYWCEREPCPVVRIVAGGGE